MEAACSYISYEQTGYFSKIVIDYLQQNEWLKQFYQHPPDIEGIKEAVANRKKFPHRRALAEELQKQYSGLKVSEKVLQNIHLLSDENTFTVTTAHQLNIFTGPLYFIYKILHAIKLAQELKTALPAYNFVPVYYMGSEDADFAELNNITVDGKRYEWQTKQTGAVGRMKVDKAFIKLIDELQSQVSVLPHGNEIMQMFRQAYSVDNTIQQSTLHFVNDCFGEYGLLVLIPDNTNLKKLFADVVEKELTGQFSRRAVHETTAVLEEQYKVQAPGRELNLFYLIDNKRERIEPEGLGFKVESLKLTWHKEEILDELKQHPERFSPNVILRGVFQETVLPNIAFIGGGGELAYWLELKKVFAEANTPYPVLLLRNSFLLAEEMWKEKAEKLSLDLKDFFASEHEVMTKIVAKHSSNRVGLNGQLKKFEDLYNEIISFTTQVDITLNEHVAALRAKSIHKLQELEKKILRAEKRKFETELRQIQKIKSALFPNNSLQERVENITGVYSKYGKELIDVLLQYSHGITPNFGIISLS